MNLIPSKQQWQRWSLPARVTYLGFLLAIVSLAIALVQPFVHNGEPVPSIPQIRTTQVSTSPQNPNISGVQGNVTIHYDRSIEQTKSAGR